jgi:hypothetical protein
MKMFWAAAFLAVVLPVLAQAETLKFPSDAPVASITIPDSWKPTETDSGIEANSPDTAIYFSIDVATAKSSDKVISDAVDFLSDNGVTIDTATQKTSEDTLNGMAMQNLDWDGTDADGPVNIGLSLASPDGETMLVITYWGTKGEQEKHAAALTSIISSLKPVQ